jgi:hypothetical protein
LQFDINQFLIISGLNTLPYLVSLRTNNLLERFFGMLKYDWLHRVTRKPIPDLVHILVTKVIQYYMRARAAKLARGKEIDNHNHADVNATLRIQELVSSGHIQVEDKQLGLCLVCSLSDQLQVYDTCVGDASCSCPADHRYICQHVLAAQSVIPLTHGMRHAATLHIHDKHMMSTIDGPKGLLKCSRLADTTKCYDISVYDAYCSCQDHRQNGICCHIMAAGMLPSYAGVLCLGHFDNGVDLEEAIDLEGGKVRRRGGPIQEPLSAVSSTTLNTQTCDEDVEVELEESQTSTIGDTMRNIKHRMTSYVNMSSLPEATVYVQMLEEVLDEWKSTIPEQSIPCTPARLQTTANRSVLFIGRRPTQNERCSYSESFKYELSSYFLIWAATKRKLEQGVE